MLSSRIGVGSSMSTPSTPRPCGRGPICSRVVFVDAFVDELDEFVIVAAHAQRAVAGVDQLDSGVHDGAQRRVELKTRCHHQHRVDESIEAVPALDDLLDPVLDLTQEFAQSQLRECHT